MSTLQTPYEIRYINHMCDEKSRRSKRSLPRLAVIALAEIALAG
jgi:hypothetical protein